MKSERLICTKEMLLLMKEVWDWKNLGKCNFPKLYFRECYSENVFLWTIHVIIFKNIDKLHWIFPLIKNTVYANKMEVNLKVCDNFVDLKIIDGVLFSIWSPTIPCNFSLSRQWLLEC